MLMTYCMFNFDLGKPLPLALHLKVETHCITFQDLTPDSPLTLWFLLSLSLPAGYVQVMSDLSAPLLFITQTEVESFWCLTGFMEMVVSTLLSCHIIMYYHVL